MIDMQASFARPASFSFALKSRLGQALAEGVNEARGASLNGDLLVGVPGSHDGYYSNHQVISNLLHLVVQLALFGNCGEISDKEVQCDSSLQSDLVEQSTQTTKQEVMSDIAVQATAKESESWTQTGSSRACEEERGAQTEGAWVNSATKGLRVGGGYHVYRTVDTAAQPPGWTEVVSPSQESSHESAASPSRCPGRSCGLDGDAAGGGPRRSPTPGKVVAAAKRTNSQETQSSNKASRPLQTAFGKPNGDTPPSAFRKVASSNEGFVTTEAVAGNQSDSQAAEAASGGISGNTLNGSFASAGPFSGSPLKAAVAARLRRGVPPEPSDEGLGACASHQEASSVHVSTNSVQETIDRVDHLLQGSRKAGGGSLRAAASHEVLGSQGQQPRKKDELFEAVIAGRANGAQVVDSLRGDLPKASNLEQKRPWAQKPTRQSQAPSRPQSASSTRKS